MGMHYASKLLRITLGISQALFAILIKLSNFSCSVICHNLVYLGCYCCILLLAGTTREESGAH